MISRHFSNLGDPELCANWGFIWKINYENCEDEVILIITIQFY